MLSDLPFELLAQISVHLTTAQAFSHLSLTCTRLHDFVQKDGWRTFVQERFPSISTPPCWKEAAHGLSTLSRNWDRRALVARYFKPKDDVFNLATEQHQTTWQPPQGQTMGFQPIIDAYEEWRGDTWTSRKEVVAFSAGAELVLRTKNSGLQKNTQRDEAVHDVNWVTYKPPNAAQGIDDITALKLLRPYNSAANISRSNTVEPVLFGSAKGNLQLLQIPISADDYGPSVESSATFHTDNRPVRSADVSATQHPHIAASLSDSTVAIYDLASAATCSTVQPSSEISVISSAVDRPGQRVWSTRWLSSTRLAIGLGPSDQPLHVYQLSESGLDPVPIRKWALEMPEYGGNDIISLGPGGGILTTSVYPICPLPATAHSGHEEGELFLTGGVDGVVRYVFVPLE